MNDAFRLVEKPKGNSSKAKAANPAFVTPAKYDPNAPKVAAVPAPVDQPEAEEEIVLVSDAVKPVSEQPTAKQDEPVKKLTGIRDWHEQVGYVSAKRMRDCICFQLDVYKDPWWVGKINASGRGFLRNEKIAGMLNDATPEDYEWSENPLIGWRVKLDGSDDKLLEKRVARHPENEAERVKLRDMFGVTTHTVPFLAKKDCKRCKGSGYYSVFPYPDAPRLPMTVECPCCSE